MGNCLYHLQQFYRDSRESSLACLYLQSLGFRWCRGIMDIAHGGKSFKQILTILKALESLKTIVEKHWKSVCWALYWRNKMNILYLSWNNQVWVWMIFKTIFSKTLIDSQYLVSPGQSVEHYEWRFMPIKNDCGLNIILLSLFHQLPFHDFFNLGGFNFLFINIITNKVNRNK